MGDEKMLANSLNERAQNEGVKPHFTYQMVVPSQTKDFLNVYNYAVLSNASRGGSTYT